MKTVLKVVVLSVVALLNFGCAVNYYNIPRESYEEKVRVLGVAPIFVDADSDIRLPDKEPLLALVRDLNRRNEAELVARLQDTGSYLSVRMPEVPADQLFSSLFFRRERRSDAGVVYNKYFYKLPELKDFIARNSLDAVMLVVVSGLTKQDKLYSSNYLAFLEHDYNSLVMTAQVLDAEGNVLWEYPNFQQRLRPLPPLLNLQYADFDEAAANVSEMVDVKFKTIPGIGRAFAKPVSSPIRRDLRVSKLYENVFDEMVTLLKPPFRWPWEASRIEARREQPAPERTRVEAARAELPKSQPVTIEPVKPAPAAPAAEPAPPAPEEIKVESLTPEK